MTNFLERRTSEVRGVSGPGSYPNDTSFSQEPITLDGGEPLLAPSTLVLGLLLFEPLARCCIRGISFVGLSSLLRLHTDSGWSLLDRVAEILQSCGFPLSRE